MTPGIENLSYAHNTLRWEFPLPRPHTGITVANGTQGVLIWGDDCLCLTVARTGFWDHRGGNAFTNHITYAELRSLLEAGREEEVVMNVGDDNAQTVGQKGKGKRKVKPRDTRFLGLLSSFLFFDCFFNA